MIVNLAIKRSGFELFYQIYLHTAAVWYVSWKKFLNRLKNILLLSLNHDRNHTIASGMIIGLSRLLYNSMREVYLIEEELI